MDKTNEYEIIVIVDREGVTIETSGQAERTGDFGLSKNDLSKETIEIFQYWLQEGNIRRRRELEVLGRHLFEALFDPGLRGFLDEQLVKAQSAGEKLRIQLKFKEQALDWASLPWEYMYYLPQGKKGFFLSTMAQLVLSRYIPLSKERETPVRTKDDLRVLIVISYPQPEDNPDLGPVVAEPVIAAIEKLKETYSNLHIEKLDKPTVGNLSALLADPEKKWHVVHLIGHGRYNEKEKKGEIALLDEDEESVRWVDDSTFADYFTFNPPRLVLLHLCEGGRVDLQANFAGLAPQLILAGVQAVVAMQYRITNRHAIFFSEAFYKELARGSYVDQAVQLGRYEITQKDSDSYNTRAFGTPVLYMHSNNGLILPPAEKPKSTQRGSAPRPSNAPMAGAATQEAAPGTSQAAPVASEEVRPTPVIVEAPVAVEFDGMTGVIPEGATGARQTATSARLAQLRVPPEIVKNMIHAAERASLQYNLPDKLIQDINQLQLNKSTPTQVSQALDQLFGQTDYPEQMIFANMQEELKKWLEG